ncbi:AI-2E family transporter [Aquabacter spiritensis]|uniref:Putative PurR-regulated permease PerM n=1 Tax=Aquabacter spiritensis TaxID=933073 RepID=A0A4R3LZ77_9HYPH|nr:AI-2E family transporter [Aquabacter spiritensis]TCT05586.1 putative PurR-regulated permease PerM [Aquabacter spiritensis]
MKILLGLIAAVAVAAALYAAATVFAPVTFALFVIAIVWPLQRGLAARMPMPLAAVLTLVVTLGVIAGISSLVVWGFSHVGQWVFLNAARFQTLYGEAALWLDGHGLVLAGTLAEHFDVRWMLRAFQDVSSRLNAFGSFMVVTLVFVILGLLEVDAVQSQLESRRRRGGGSFLIAAGADIAEKFQIYMVVRTLMSVATGVVVWGFTLASGLELALAWGAIAFAFNYIPFIGPLIATLLPTLFALAQFESWEMAAFVFVSLTIIQFLSGSYLEPRITGARLAVSPFMVLFAVFFFAFLWGLPGAFIGVPMLIAGLTLCAHHPATRFIADLFSGNPAPPDPAAPDGAAPDGAAH